MTSPLLIYGTGGLGREVAALVQAANQRSLRWTLMGFVDDHARASSLRGIPVFSSLQAALANTNTTGLNIAICIANPTIHAQKLALIRTLAPAVNLPNLIHPEATLDPEWVTLGEGNIVGPGVRVTADVTIGDFNIINMNAVVAHDVAIGSHCQINPGALLNGGITLGDRVIVGAGAAILPRLTVGSDATIALGAVVGMDVAAGDVVAGNPARVVRRAKAEAL